MGIAQIEFLRDDTPSLQESIRQTMSMLEVVIETRISLSTYTVLTTWVRLHSVGDFESN